MKQQVVILGSGESGVGAALLAVRMGYDVFVSDFGIIADTYKQELIDANISFEEGKHSSEKVLSADIVIKSPGIPEKAVLILALRAANRNIISEIEFAYKYCKGEIVAITGSNGKTTTTLLTDYIIRQSDKTSVAAGNIGRSLSRVLVEDEEYDVYVVELSSFQLDDIKEFSPSIAILLNITPDHLDRYEYDFDKYAASKARIFENLSSDGLLISNQDDQTVKSLLADTKSFDTKMVSLSDTDLNEMLAHSVLTGKHNRFNASCAIHACMHLGVSKEAIIKGLSSFKNHPHRLENVAVLDGVQWINDSKATNIDSVEYALDAMTRPVVWIAGGSDKGNDYKEIENIVTSKVKALICMGIDNTKLVDSFGTKLPKVVECSSMNTAVQMANDIAVEGDVVLLSPACASFDLFKNYIDRGDQFKTEVWNQFKKQVA